MARILLVEDDGDVLPLLEHFLVSMDHYVTTAINVATAVALLRTQPFELVISDVSLPDGTGIAIADIAREIGVKVLLLTGFGLRLEPGTLAKYDYLLKPIRLADLVVAVDRRLADKESGGRRD